MRHCVKSTRWLFLAICFLVQVHHTKAEPSKDSFLNWPSWAFYLHKHPGYKNYKPPVDIRKNGCKWGTWVTFAQKIEAIQARVGDYSNPADLLLSKDFLAMYKHRAYYHETIMAYITNPAYTLEQKTIALYVTQPSIEQAWQLYKEKKIDVDLLSVICGIIFSDRVEIPHSLAEKSKSLYGDKEKPIIEQMLKELSDQLPLHKALESVLNYVFPRTWEKHVMPRSTYHAPNYLLPFQGIISTALMEKKQFEKWLDGRMPECSEYLIGPEYPPYFLMVLEHPQYYYNTYFGPYSGCDYNDHGIRNGIAMLQDPDISDEEKSLAIFGMSQFGLYDLTSFGCYDYAEMLEYACEWYEKGLLTVRHLNQLFVCDFPTFYKYPFFILDYKKKDVQRALDKFIRLPMIPSKLKEIAQKVKNGTLATKEEMAYMEGYRTFRKTYFTLYESVPASK